MKRLLPLTQLFAAAATLLLASTLFAQEPLDSERALSLGHAGLSAFESEDYQAALKNFELAESAAHSPVFLLYMAKARLKLGELLRARSLLRQVAHEELSADAPPSWQRAHDQAHENLKQIAGQIPSLALSVRGGTPPFLVSIAERQQRVGRGTVRLELDPGSYSCLVQDAQGRSVTQKLSVAAFERKKSIVVEFPAEHSVARNADPAASAPEPNNLLALSTLGVGIVAASVGIVAGTVAGVQTRNLKAQCDGNVCPRDQKYRGERAKTWANVASASLVIGAVGIGGGLLLYDSPDSRAEQVGRGPFINVAGSF